ncbi:hypothetical protein ACOMHN_027579 [Nucella lapillus]
MQGRLQHLKDSDLGDRVNESDLYQQMRYPYSANHTRDQGSSQHALTGRSDDGGPLEAVTNQLAQHMTVLAADVQTLKTQHTADVQALTASDAQQHRAIQAARGSTFVQWGSSTCAGPTELVYSGVVGGSRYDHSGAAANALCLSLSPKLQDLISSNADGHARLYGGEYETDDSHQHRGPACAVCRSPEPTTIMVPGTNVCSSGWTRQYSGFLMAGHYTYKAATEFICVDTKLDSSMHSSANENGYLLYYTKTQCGSLPCPPYENNKLVTCAVCSK